MRYIDQPLTVCNTVIRNRIAVPAMADFGMTEEDGRINARHAAHYKEFAEGGAGLVITEACAVTKMREPRNTIDLSGDGCLPGLTELASAAHANGAVALVQLLNTGLEIMEENAIAEIPRARFLQYKSDFLAAAIRCKKAGFDGVELHAAHGYYLNQVIETNGRTDEYGGKLENRLQLITELIAEIKGASGDGFLVSVRFGSRDYHELVQSAILLEAAGADLLDVSQGCWPYENVPESFGYDGKIYAASLVKQSVHIPVICVGGIFTAAQAEDILEKGYADMTAVGRGHLCDPAWANKALAGLSPTVCKNCKRCLWYADGRKCPARRESSC